MKNAMYILTLLLAVADSGITISAAESPVKSQATIRCTVNDTSGTPLDIRSIPNGKKIVGTLKNGTRVAFTTEPGDGQDRSRDYVRLDKKGAKSLGWVLRESLECD